MKKYRLICGLLVASILANACSSPTHPTQAQSQENEPFSTFAIGIGSYEKEAEVSVDSSSTSPSSDSSGGFGELFRTLLVIGLSIFAIKAASDFVDENYDTSGWTDAEKKVGRQMTRTEHEEYYREHPETWTPVYVLPSE